MRTPTSTAGYMCVSCQSGDVCVCVLQVVDVCVCVCVYTNAGLKVLRCWGNKELGWVQGRTKLTAQTGGVGLGQTVLCSGFFLPAWRWGQKCMSIEALLQIQRQQGNSEASDPCLDEKQENWEFLGTFTVMAWVQSLVRKLKIPKADLEHYVAQPPTPQK